ncbi:hypothetical protein SDC9_203338 [bioreactor metagenome]|uniref:Uncharacterized protein n=1 Tax=bioreactor metagenome TaxID=1076179 RepID=A0A645J5A4_9ZZZZ
MDTLDSDVDEQLFLDSQVDPVDDVSGILASF